MQIEPRHIARIRNRKTNQKPDKSIWSCLTNEPTIDTPKKIERVIPILDKKQGRAFRRKRNLLNKLAKGVELSDREIRRYVRMSKIMGEVVPEWVQSRFSKPKEKGRMMGEYYKKVILTKKPERIPKNRKRIPKKYDAYINSKHWTIRKNLYWQSNNRMCAVCGTSRMIHLHHAVYEKFGSELDCHLFPLCENHHEMFHKKIGKTKRNMLAETILFISDQRASL